MFQIDKMLQTFDGEKIKLYIIVCVPSLAKTRSLAEPLLSLFARATGTDVTVAIV
jgi:hypothetical protein